MDTIACIGLGSNLGDRHIRIDAAISALARTTGIEVEAVSSLKETAPVGGPSGQGAFLNAAVRLSTSLDTHALHARLREIEQEAGRLRRVRWGERSLDLDLLLYQEKILHEPELTIPHPRMALRRFVLAPLAEIAPEAIHPITKRTVADLLANLDRRPSYVAIVIPTTDPVAERLGRELFEDVARRLGALTVRRQTLVERSTEPPNSVEALVQCMARLASRLGACNRIGDHLGDRWVVTDFCLVMEYLRLLLTLRRFREKVGETRPEVHEYLDQLEAEAARMAAWPNALQPTFFVTPGRSSGIHSMNLTFPELVLEAAPDDHEARTREILAACASTRVG